MLNADRNPNTAGAQLTGVATGDLPQIIDGIREGKIKALVVLGEDVVEEELLQKLELLVAIDTLPGKATEQAQYVLPGATFTEKRGTFINAKHRLQRLNQAIPAPGIARPEWQTLVALLNELGADGAYLTLEDVFADMARSLPALAGLNLSKIGDGGVELDLTGKAPAEPATTTTTTTATADADAARREARPPEAVKQ